MRPWTIILLALLGSASALGQLTQQDIDALRERGQREGWTFKIGLNGVTGYPLESLCGFRPPEIKEAAPSPAPSEEGRVFPARFNWEDSFTPQPVRDQTEWCGSCWAHSALGSLEYAILMQDLQSTDLSEQWMISCNQAGWGCGGHIGYAHNNMLTWGMTDPGSIDPCGDNGAVLESDFPYTHSETTPCYCPYPHHYWIDWWGWDETLYPSVDSIKGRLLEFGPVAVAFLVGSPFETYGGGVFNACGLGDGCSLTNPNWHAMVIVGWDDNQGPGGVWFVRNSWGTDWGEDPSGRSWDEDDDGVPDRTGGYARILYGCCFIGSWPAYMVYTANHSSLWVSYLCGGTRGTFANPYSLVSAGVNNLVAGGQLHVKSGMNSPEILTISKPMTIRAYGGPVRIGQ